MATTATQPSYDIFRKDRPGWIPEWVGDDWDPDPYAYQTEEELMPAGRFHGLYLQVLAEMLKPVLERLGLVLILDVFIFYRDWEGRKQRIAPDALVAPTFPQLTEAQAAHSYDLDVEPVPVCVFECTSPSSRQRDQEQKPFGYALLGIRECLVLDITDDDGQLLPEIGLYLWRLDAGEQRAVAADSQGYLRLETLGVRVRAEGRHLVMQVSETGEMLRTSSELLAELSVSEQARIEAEQRAAQAEDELARLREELARLRGGEA